MRTTQLVLFTLLPLAVPMKSQTKGAAPQFEAASVKISRPSGGSSVSGVVGGPGSSDPGRMSFPNDTLADLVSIAYAVPKYRVFGPDWLDTDRFDIVATVGPGATKDQVREMLKATLAERFKLVAHAGQREMHVYEMTLAKPGPSLRPAREIREAPSGPFSPGPMKLANDGFPLIPAGVSGDFNYDGRRRMVEFHQTLDWLARRVGRELRAPVIDMTGSRDAYDFELRWAESDDPAVGPDLQEALKSQLGIRLTPKKGPIDVVVVDQADRVPVGN